MVDGDLNDRIPSDGSDLVPPPSRLSGRVRHYFDEHPEASREEFLLEALRREIHFRRQRQLGKEAGRVRWEGARTSSSSAAPRTSASTPGWPNAWHYCITSATVCGRGFDGSSSATARCRSWRSGYPYPEKVSHVDRTFSAAPHLHVRGGRPADRCARRGLHLPHVHGHLPFDRHPRRQCGVAVLRHARG